MTKKHLWFALAVSILLIPRLVMALPAGWSDDRRLTLSAGLSLAPSVITDNGNAVFVVWSDDRTGNWDIFFTRSLDSGKSWSMEINLTSNAADSFSPHLSWDNGRLLLTWLDYQKGGGMAEIYATQSLDNGNTWTDLSGSPGTTDVSNRSNSAAAFSRPRGTVNAHGTHVVWADNSSGQTLVYYRNVTVSPVTSVYASPIGATLPAIATDYGVPGHSLYVVWEENPGPSGKIFFLQSLDGGVTWTNGAGLAAVPDNISHTINASASWHPDVLVSQAGVEVAFLDNRTGSPQVFWEVGRLMGGPPVLWDDGMGSAPPNTLTAAANTRAWTDLGHVEWDVDHCTVWQDNRLAQHEIFMSIGVGNGPITPFTEYRLTFDTAESIQPSLTGDRMPGMAKHLVWVDTRDADYEIYYKRSDLVAPTTISDLGAASGSAPGEVDLTWTAPTDNTSDTVTAYAIVYDDSQILILNDFLNATPVAQAMVPQGAGQTEQLTVSGLVPGDTYYFCMVSVDAAGNTSTLSNSPSALATEPTPTATVTVTPSITPTPSISATLTVSTTVTATPTQSATFTISPTPSISPTITVSPTLTISPPASPTFTGTQTPLPFEQTSELQVYPNPATDQVTLAWALDKSGIVTVKVFNVVGEQVSINSEHKIAGRARITLDTSSFAAGIYLLRLTVRYDGGGTHTFPLRKIAVIRP